MICGDVRRNRIELAYDVAQYLGSIRIVKWQMICTNP
jgi:hypothetical protein